ncbi:hypothetical protein [Methylobacterium sp. WL7]|uniref:hypothetical protein n=1 Tax=Methylobacterium sp. WL7 TaxID=2603900 RepID=UPI0011C76CC5|nr:hypothetical protein [Methylobacterium sp. WL7]TXN42526.1 hypothetical protein FV233_22290 [Methylobacterium sp. WL7]
MTEGNDKKDLASVVLVHGQVAVLRISMEASSAVPLEILSPSNIEILTWAITGFSGDRSACPCCLLVLRPLHSDFLGDFSSISVRTHIHDRTFRLHAEPALLTAGEILVLTRAVIAAIEPRNAGSLQLLLPVIAPALDAICLETDERQLTRPDSRTGTVVASGLDFVPFSLIARAAAGYVCEFIQSAKVRTGPEVKIAMTLRAPVDVGGADTVLLVGNGRHAAARIIEAA